MKLSRKISEFQRKLPKHSQAVNLQQSASDTNALKTLTAQTYSPEEHSAENSLMHPVGPGLLGTQATREPHKDLECKTIPHMLALWNAGHFRPRHDLKS